jgi:hypothetical protein
MKADEFLKIVRKGSDKLRVDNLVLNTGEQEFHGKGMLKISEGKIKVDFIFNADEKPPALRYGVFTKKDNWKLCGLIEDQLQFKCEVAPGGSASFGARATTLCTLFESLVRLLFKHLNLKDEAEAKDESLRLFFNLILRLRCRER